MQNMRKRISGLWSVLTDPPSELSTKMTPDAADALLAIDVDVMVPGSHGQSAVGRPSDAEHPIGGISQGLLELQVLAGGSHRGPPGTIGKNMEHMS